MADITSNDLSTDIVLEKICEEMDINLSNDRQFYIAYVQENVQSLIMLYFSGACICIIALMIIWSIVSLEAKNEKHGFYIKRCIGMSKRQVDLNIFGKSLLRCLSAFLIGYIIYFSLQVCESMRASYEYNGESADIIKTVKSIVYGLKYGIYAPTVGRIVIISLLCVALPLVLILYAKKGLRKDGDTK